MSSQSSTSTFVIPSIFGWSHFEERDLEAQTISGTHEHFDVQLPMPSAACTHAHRTRASIEDSNAVDDFFGGASSRALRGTQDSRHDAVSLPVHLGDSDLPPPYAESANPPAYTRHSEHPTLAMYLFTFGFLFPLFWVAGALILVSPLRAPEDWERTKTEAEREWLIASMRREEMKWAKRCLFALSVLALVVVVVVLATVFLMKS